MPETSPVGPPQALYTIGYEGRSLYAFLRALPRLA
jgi:hypothetical protein